MNQPYIFESNKNSELGGSDAVIMLPDIYGQTDYSKRSVEEFADAFKKPVFMLDYFYLITNKVNNFTEVDREKAHSLMQNFKGDDFVTFFKKVLGEIKEVYPAITQFIVIGFCFGGRLAYIAGGEDRVCKVVSFYGGGPHSPNYIERYNLQTTFSAFRNYILNRCFIFNIVWRMRTTSVKRNSFANSVLSSGNICKSPTKTKTNYDKLCNRRIYFFNFSQNFFEKSYKIITFKILHKRMCFFPIYFRKVIYFVCNQIKIVQHKNRFLECISKFFNATL